MRKLISKNIFIGATILALAGIFSRAIGAFYKIPLTNTLGANGMGVYYLVFPLYSLLLVLCSSGVATAVSTIIAKERAKNNRKNELIIFRISLIYSAILSIISAIVLVVFADKISLLQGNINAKLGYFAIAPALIFASIISVVRAFFQSMQNMFPTSISYIIEQIVKVVFGLYFAKRFLEYGIEYSVFGAVLGVSISEFVSLIMLMINYLHYRKKNNYVYIDTNMPELTYSYLEAFKIVFKYSLPATLSSIIIPITSFLDSFMVINILVGSGFTSAVATTLYGLNNGIVASLVNLPIIFISALSTAFMPNLSSNISELDKDVVNKKCSMFVKMTFLISLPFVVFIIIYAKDIVYLLYSRGLDSRVINEFEFVYKLLIVSSGSIIYYGFLQTFTAILQAISKPVQPLISLSVSLLIRFVLVVILVNIPSLNIFGVVLANTVFLIVACLISLMYIKRSVELKFSLYRMFVVPIFSIFVSSMFCLLSRELLVDTHIYIYAVFTAIVGGILYIALLFILKCFSVEERNMLPKFIKKKKKLV